MKRSILVIALAFNLSACATVRESYPTRTATEELLISQAADDAAAQLRIKVSNNRKCFLDTTNFEGTDAKYAVSAIRQKLLEQGLALMDKRDDADTIIEVRAGALSIDSKSRQITLPGLSLDRLIPGIQMPLAYNQWSQKTDQGIAKISAFAYDKASGQLITVAETVIGQSIRKKINGETVVLKKQ